MNLIYFLIFNIFIIFTNSLTLYADTNDNLSNLVNARKSLYFHKYVEADNYYQLALKNISDVTILEEYLIFSVSHKNLSQSYNIAQKILSLNPKHNLAALVISIYEAKNNNIDKAISNLEKYTPSENSINQLFLITLKGIDYYSKDEISHFKNLASNIKLYAPDLYYTQLAYLNVLSNKNDKAKESFKYLLSNFPNVQNTLAYIRIIYKDNEAESIRYFQDLLSDNYITDARAKLYIQRDDKNIPKNILSSILVKIASFATDEINNITQVSERFLLIRLAYFLNENNSFATYSISKFYETIGDYESALYFYRLIRRNSYYKRITLNTVLDYLEELKLYDKALTIAEEAIFDDKNNPLPFIRIGQIYNKTGNYPQAILAYSNAISISIKNNYKNSLWLAKYLRGIVYDKNDDWNKAEKDLLDAYNINPNDPLLLNYIAYSWVVKDHNINLALKMLEKAVKLSSAKKPSILDSYSVALLRNKQAEKALYYSRLATQMDNYNPEFLEHLADAMWQNGYIQQAFLYWNKSSTLYTQQSDIRRVTQKLAKDFPDYLNKNIIEKQYKELDNFVTFSKKEQ